LEVEFVDIHNPVWRISTITLNRRVGTFFVPTQHVITKSVTDIYSSSTQDAKR